MKFKHYSVVLNIEWIDRRKLYYKYILSLHKVVFIPLGGKTNIKYNSLFSESKLRREWRREGW